LVHELGHRLMGDLVPSNVDHHSIIFLFVYDVWTHALAFSATEWARRFKQFLREHRK
jgi:hypothetical protein